MKNLIPHFIQEQYLKGKTKGRLQAYTLFADLSGFTALTEHLMAQGARGAEQLSLALNDIFGPLVRLVYSRGGFIPYFAGDAFLAIFPAHHPRATDTGFIQTAMMARDQFAGKGFHFGGFPISIKIGLSYGSVEWGIVGRQPQAFYFRGTPVAHCAEGQMKAGKLEIVLDEALHRLVEDNGFVCQDMGEGYKKLLGTPQVKTTPGKPVALPPIEERVCLQFLPSEVLRSNQQGEFRTVVAVFLAFAGADTHELLDRFATIVLNQTHNFSGYFKEIDFSDKGGLMAIFFGAPVSFENNVSRALECLYAIQTEAAPLRAQSPLQFKAGVTIGTAYTGIVGGVERCQYAAVGNRVNLAVRLMSQAHWGEVLVDNEIVKNRQYRFVHQGDIKYKGIKESVPTFLLQGRNLEYQQSSSGPLVGRAREMKALLDFAAPLFEGRCAGVALLLGEAGVGKTRLSHELRKAMLHNKVAKWYTGAADQILRKPLNAFQFFLRNYFDQSLEVAAQENRACFESRFEALVQALEQQRPPGHALLLRELQRLRSVLAALLGIYYPNSLWEQLDAKGRYDNTHQAILHLLTVESALHPFVLEIEDAHWLDEESAELLRDLARRLNRLPILLLITSRYLEDGREPELLPKELLAHQGLPVLTLPVLPLDAEAVGHFAELHLHGKIAPAFHEQLLRHTNQNPFYVEQVLEYCIERNLLRQENGMWHVAAHDIDLSGSIQSILTARIDRLSALTRETVKAAAVIGREFEVPVLNEVMNHQEEFARANGNTQVLLQEQIKTAERGQIWQALTELRYIFRHSLLREAAYNMQLRSRLSQLHALIAQAIEQLHAHDLHERYADLAFHYEQAGIIEKTCEYLLKAADFARRNYQNQQALAYYDKLVQLLPRKADPVQVIKTHIRRGKVLEQIGRWDECRQSYARALRAAQRAQRPLLLGQALNHLGQVLLLQGDYAGALKHFRKAADLFETEHDAIGMARVYGNLGNLYFRQGQYQDAKQYFSRSISTARQADPGAISAQAVAQFALAYMNQGDYEQAVRTIEEQIPLSQQLQDKPGLASLYTNLGIIYFEKGDLERALHSHQEGLALSEALGNKMLMAINIGCTGSVYERRGNYTLAMQHFVRDLEIVEELGDKQGTAIALNLIGELLSYMGEFGQAIDYLQKSLMLCESLGYRKGHAKALNTLGDIFYFTGQFQRSLEYYNQAIELTRHIDAKWVLATSLMEKGMVLAELQQADTLQQVAGEVLEMANALNSNDLAFEAHILQAKAQHLQGYREQAIQTLQALDSRAHTLAQQAALCFERYLLMPHEEQLRLQALNLYQHLYEQTPKFLFKHRMEILN